MELPKHITHTIQLILTMKTNIESRASLFITNLENHFIIFGQSWIKDHKIIIDMTNNFLAFWLGHYIYI